MIKSEQIIWNNTAQKWESSQYDNFNPKLCLIFTSRLIFDRDGIKAIDELKKTFPNTAIVTTSSAGNILDTEVLFNSITATLIEFEKTDLVIHSYSITKDKHKELGNSIAKSFNKKGLKLVLLLSTANLNAGNLIDGVNEGFDNDILVSGGLAGDGVRFDKTLVGINEAVIEDNIVAIGFYGEALEVAHGTKGGWVPFGPQRTITKAKDNELFEIDNKPALEIYKEYLGEKAKELPSSGLLFPLAIIDKDTNEYIIRGLQDINEANNSIILFSNVEEGQTVNLMRANHSILIDGAGDSASDALKSFNHTPQFSLLISCVARRLALDQLIEEEIEEVRTIFGDATTICGFYSYSEFSPLKGKTTCSLHNQTMTITTLSEK